MNKIINGKRYDTDKAEFLAEYSNGYTYGDFNYYEESLYRKRTGEHFLHMEGGANSRCARMVGSNSWSGGAELRPITFNEARAWAEEHMDGDEYEEAFGVIDEDDETIAATFTLPSSVKTQLEREAQRTGKSQSAIVSELIKGL